MPRDSLDYRLTQEERRLLSHGIFHKISYANGPGAAASVCRLREAVGAGDQGAVRSPQRDNVSGTRPCPLVEPPRRGFVQVPEGHPADLAARSPHLAPGDAVFAAFVHDSTRRVHGSHSTVPERIARNTSQRASVRRSF
jgi:hypothetical protein